jgi:hypothetical protein
VPRLPRLGFPPGPPFRGAPSKKESPGGTPIPARAGHVCLATLGAARALGEARGPTGPGAALRVTPFADPTPLAAPVRPLKGAPLCFEQVSSDGEAAVTAIASMGSCSILFDASNRVAGRERRR